MTLRLLPPPGGGQDPSRLRGRRHAHLNSLTPAERRNLRQALHNLRLRLGGWDVLASMMEVPMSTLSGAAARGGRRGSPGLALRAARVAGSTVEALLAGKLTPAGTCPHCGAERRAS